MDKMTFYIDDSKEWRWRRRTPEGETVGASTEGYSNLSDAVSNARRDSGLDIDLSVRGRHRQTFSGAQPPVEAVIDPKYLEHRA